LAVKKAFWRSFPEKRRLSIMPVSRVPRGAARVEAMRRGKR
jgi:hypothetical protein